MYSRWNIIFKGAEWRTRECPQRVLWTVYDKPGVPLTHPGKWWVVVLIFHWRTCRSKCCSFFGRLHLSHGTMDIFNSLFLNNSKRLVNNRKIKILKTFYLTFWNWKEEKYQHHGSKHFLWNSSYIFAILFFTNKK